jgi:thiamine-phosphate pyrophosphorylase
METGIHGIAVSGLITQSEHKKRQSNNLKMTYGTIII